MLGAGRPPSRRTSGPRCALSKSSAVARRWRTLAHVATSRAKRPDPTPVPAGANTGERGLPSPDSSSARRECNGMQEVLPVKRNEADCGGNGRAPGFCWLPAENQPAARHMLARKKHTTWMPRRRMQGLRIGAAWSVAIAAASILGQCIHGGDGAVSSTAGGSLSAEAGGEGRCRDCGRRMTTWERARG